MAAHSSTLAWKVPSTEKPGGRQSMGSRRVRHDWATSLSLFTFMHWRRKWQPTQVFLPGESQGQGRLVGCCLWGRTELDMTAVTAAAAAWKTVWSFLKKLGIKPPYYPAIPLLGIYTEETKIENDTYIPLFIATLFTIATIWKQPRCPSTDKGKKVLVHIHKGILLSHKKEQFWVSSNEMDEPRVK